jgi:tetratricopeptide (TPR) repeat protein
MKRLVENSVWMALAFAFLAAGVGVSPAAAQEIGAGDRIAIVVPNLAPQGGADNGFGEDVADELRDRMRDLERHHAVSEGDIDDARKQFDLAREDLYNCVSARQLAMQKNWGLVLCGSYEPAGDRQVQVTANFIGSQTGDTFEVPAFTVSERDPDQAAQQILQAFDRYENQLRRTVFCQQYMESEQWDQALENCNAALEITPTYSSALYMKSFILRETERYEEALSTLDTLLEADPIHQDALKLAGITATQAGMSEQAREYFDRYMELNPGDSDVRLAIAVDIANAGDPAGALEFVQEGASADPDNIDLIRYKGHFAAQAASKAESAANDNGAEPVDPATITGYYQTAAESYQRVFEEQGSETEPEILERLIVALFKLDQVDEAVELGARAVEVKPENANIWDSYSRALEQAGQPGEALAAIEKAEELGKDSPALTQRKAVIQLKQGRESAGVATLQSGVDSGKFGPSDAFRTIFAHAYQNKFQQGQLDAAFNLLDAAGPLAVQEEDRLTRNFWRGYILYEKGKRAHEPMTAASAREAKPLFERALQLFQAARGYEKIHASADVPKLIDAVERFIEIEEALIKRGR